MSAGLHTLGVAELARRLRARELSAVELAQDLGAHHRVSPLRNSRPPDPAQRLVDLGLGPATPRPGAQHRRLHGDGQLLRRAGIDDGCTIDHDRLVAILGGNFDRAIDDEDFLWHFALGPVIGFDGERLHLAGCGE